MSAKKKDKALWEMLTTEENAEEIYRQLFQGVGPAELARKVQEQIVVDGVVVPMFPNKTVHEVTQWFNTYRRKKVEPDQTRALLEASKFRYGRGALRKRLDVVAELEDLAVTQRERFEKGKKYEAQAPVPLGAVTELAKDYRSTLVDLAKIYLETGLIHRVPKKIEAALSVAMGGRPVFEFTEEEAARFEKSKLLEGITPEVVAEAQDDC